MELSTGKILEENLVQSALHVTILVGGRRSRPKRSVVRVHDAFNKLNTEYKLPKE